MKNAAQKKLEISTPEISEIIYRSPHDLKSWPNNPRKHSEKQRTKLKANIEKFGFTNPPIVDETATILSGHGRIEAAIELGLPMIPVRVISGLTEADKVAFVIADNKLGLESDWDDTLLKAQMEIIIQNDFNIELTGFSTAEIDIMFDGAEKPAASDPDDLQPDDMVEEVVSRVGDLYQLGDHLLLCGNALETSSYQNVMQDDSAQMIISDPPFNMAISGHLCGKGKVKHDEFPMASGEMSQEEFTDFLSKALSHMHASTREGAIIYLFIDWRHLQEMLDATKALFGAPRQLCVWAKTNGGMGTFYRSQHELVFVFKKGNAPHVNNFELGQHGRYRTNVWSYAGVNSFGNNQALLKLHPTVKPVSLIADAIRDCSHRKGIVLDPFAGSGTILIAAERTGRYVRAIELDPHYVDIAVMRWQRVTGNEAVLAATGQTFDQVRAERLSVQG